VGAPWTDLREAIAALRVTVPDSFESQVRQYLTTLARWERAGRLTGYRDLGAQVRHLVIESLMLLSVVPAPGAPLLDIGTGAGVPGLILKLARPDWRVALMEAGRRRANFLRDAARTLGMTGLAIHHGRAESLAGSLGERFRTVTMRAVVDPGRGARLARPFLEPDSVLIMTLGPAAAPESGEIREVTLAPAGDLPGRRRFLIMRRAEIDAAVSRGTVRTHDRGGEPERRRR
jgi:16S rRNA (guanine527-N7)-methyltransferase